MFIYHFLKYKFLIYLICHKDYAETVTLYTKGNVGVQVINTV